MSSVALQLVQAHGSLMHYAVVDGVQAFVDDVVRLGTTSPNHGGRRWWFRSGVTGKRAAEPYLFPNRRRCCHRTGADPNPANMHPAKLSRLTACLSALGRSPVDASRVVAKPINTTPGEFG